MIVVIAIIAILTAIITPNAFMAIEKAKVTRVIADMKVMGKAAIAYGADVGFFPPDIPQGVDPGFMKALPYDIHTGAEVDPDPAFVAIALSPNWKDIVNARWNGPYLEKYPLSHPWGGNYDYDYWIRGITHPLNPGLYIGLRSLPTSVMEKLNQLEGFASLGAGWTDQTEYLINPL